MARSAASIRFMPRDFTSCLKFASSTGSRVLLNDLSAHAFVHQTAVFTIWAFISPIASSGQRTICGNDATAVTEKGFIFALNPTGTLRLQITDGSSATLNVISVGFNVRPNRWQAVGVTCNGLSSNATFFYWDGGSTIASSTPAGTVSALGTGDCSFPLMINVCNGATPASPFGGFMDEISFLSANTTITDFTNFVLRGVRPTTGLRGYYKFDEGSGNTQTDQDGIINGSSATIQYITNYLVSKKRTAATARSAAATRSATA